MQKHSSGSLPAKAAAAFSSLRRLAVARAASCLLLASAPVGAQVEFEDVTNEAGIDYAGESYGASVGYANTDVLPDFFLSRHRNAAALLINQADGTFENRAFEVDAWQSAPTSDQHGGAFADFDNDGDADLLISAGARYPSQFLVNNGVYLSDQVQLYTFDRPQWGGRLPVWFDFNNDGLLDFGMTVQGQAMQLFEQEPNDFARANFRAEHQCENNDYALLTDLSFDGYHDLLCITQAQLPEHIYDFRSGYPFIDITGVVDNFNYVVDSLVADFDGDLLPELFALRGRTRISGAAITGTNSIEAHLIESGSSATVKFQTDGDVTFELHWSDRNVGDVHIGAADVHPPLPNAGEPIRMVLSPADPNVQGMPPYDPATDSGIFIGYAPATQTWTMIDAAAPGAGGGDADGSYLYAFIDSTTPVSGLNVTGLGALDLARQPLYLKYDPGLGRYTQQIQATGLNAAVKCVAAVAADFDNDMDQDLYYVCRDAVENLGNMLFLNDGNGIFTEVPDGAGANGPVGFGVGLSENVVTTDYDVDGNVDLLVMNGLALFPEEPYGNGGPEKLFRNLGNGNHWIEIDLEGNVSNRDGIGAVVTITAGGKAQMREQNGGYHRWAQNDKRLHFGLAGNAAAGVEVRWPSGQLDTFVGVPADHLYRAVEGADELVEVEVPTDVPPSQCAETAGPPDIIQGTDTGMFIWQAACSSNTWNVRVTSAGATPQPFRGAVRSDAAITAFNGILLEPDDVLSLDGSSTQLNYQLTVGNGGLDGYDFTVTDGSRVCVGINGNISSAVVGRNNIPVTLPVDLATLGPCSISDPVVTIEDASGLENNPAGNLVFDLTLDFGAPEVVSVDFTTINGLALAPGDYAATSGTVEFQPNETTATIVIPIVDDSDIEFAETFSISLSNPQQVFIGDDTAIGTIEDDDGGLCGAPVYDKATEQGLFVWQHCATGEWYVRATAGGITDTFIGTVQSEDVFASVTPFSIEANDTLDFTADPLVINYALNVAGDAQDGFQFRTGASGTACVDLTSPALPVYLGATRIPVTPPFDLITTGTCFPPDVDLVTVLGLLTPDPKPRAGSDVSFEYRISNTSVEGATNVFLVSPLPPGLSYVSHLASAGAFDPASGMWFISASPAASTATLRLTAMVDPGQEGNKITLSTSAASGQQPDPSSAGDRLSVTLTVADRNVPVTDGGGLTLVGSPGPGGSVPPVWDNAATDAILDALRRYLDDPIVTGPGRIGATGVVALSPSPQSRPIFDGDFSPSGLSATRQDGVMHVTRTQHSAPLRTLGAGTAYSVSWVVGGNPAEADWRVGLSGRENGANWSDVEFGLECNNGVLSAWHHGAQLAMGGRLSAGDRLTLKVSGTTLEYQKNGETFAAAHIAGARDYRVDASVRSAAAGLGGFALSLP